MSAGRKDRESKVKMKTDLKASAMTGQTSILVPNVTLFDGVSKSLKKEMNVLVIGNKIAEVSSATIDAAEGTTVLKPGPDQVLMPGIIDAHWHCFFSAISMADFTSEHISYLHMVAASEAEETLMRGVTTVRDCGGPNWGLHRAVDEGLLKGPRIYTAGALLSQTGGHGEIRTRSEGMDYVHPLNTADWSRIVDSPDEVRKAARHQLRMGSHYLKMTIGGGYGSLVDPLDASQFTFEEIRACVEVAENWGTYVMTHGYTVEAITRALDAGVKSIEHGQLLDRATLERIAKTEGAWLSTQPFTDSHHDYFNDIQNAKLATVAEGTDKMYRMLKEIPELKVAWGTDIFYSRPECSKQISEYLCERMLKWYTPAEVLKMATGTNGEIMKLCGNRDPYPAKLGVIEKDAYADLLLVDGNPMDNLDVIGKTDNLRVIMKDGTLFKNTLN